MAVTYPLALPSTSQFASAQIRPRSVVGQTISPFTGGSQVQAHQGQWWECDIVLRTLERADAEAWIAFFAQLNGREGTFLMGPPNGATPRGLAGGTPLVNGASQTGGALITDGWTFSVGTLKAGDYFQLGSGLATELYKVTADVTADGAGNATFDIWPDLKTSPANNAALTVTSAVGLWRLAENAVPHSIDNAGFYNMAFGARDAL